MDELLAIGLCECGCGKSTNIATKTSVAKGHVKGEYLRFAVGHSLRIPYQLPPRITHGLSSHPLYRAWGTMKSRCSNPNATGYENYGGRGITVCERWENSFEYFLVDMGERPEGKTLDRIDVNGNYEPGNCRWATRQEQQANRRG